MFNFVEITALAALAVVVVQQILKLGVVPGRFANNRPVETNIILSIVASVIVTYQTAISLTSVGHWIAYIALVSVVAAVTYNNTIKHSESIRSLENK